MGRGGAGGKRRAIAPAASAGSLRIRDATVDDIPALARLKREVAARTYAAHAGPALERWLDEHAGEEYFRYRVGRKDYYVHVAVDDTGSIVGYGGFRQRGDRADGNSVGLYVKRSGMGIGSRLDDARVKRARELGCRRMRVSVWRTNSPAQDFVRGRGFERTGGYRETTTGVMVDHYEREVV